MEPAITLSHYETPLHLLTEYGGWAGDQMLGFWKNYVTTVFRRYKGKVKLWMTFNEVNNLYRRPMISGGMLSLDPENKVNPQHVNLKDQWQGYYNLLVANAWTVKIGHEIDPENRIGCMLSSSSVALYPANPDPENMFGAYSMARKATLFFGDPLCLGIIPGYVKREWKENNCAPKMDEEGLEMIRRYTVDYYAFSYYRSAVYEKSVSGEIDTGGYKGVDNPYLKEISPKPWSWPVDPLGLRYVLNCLYDRYHLPLFIVENGIGLDEEPDENGEIHDPFRVKYARDHLIQVNEAIKDGVDVMGYLWWGPIDIVSAGTGEMKKRYGFVYVDRHNDGTGTLARSKKDSYEWMKKVCESNGEYLAEEDA